MSNHFTMGHYSADGLRTREMLLTLRAYFRDKDGPKDSSGARRKANAEKAAKADKQRAELKKLRNQA